MTATAGVILLNELMPPDIKFDLHKPIDKKEYKTKLSEFASKNPALYKENIHAITALAEKMAYYSGASVGTKDLEVFDKHAKAHIKVVEKKLAKAKTDDEKRHILVSEFNKASKNITNVKDDNNELLLQVKSAARGKPAQLARMSWSPFYAIDMNQKAKPLLIKNNFTKGLNSQEYFNVASQGRFASVQTANATSEPGELGKILVANADDMVITMHDCGTRNGVCESPQDHHIVGRYEAGTNKLIDATYWKELKNNKNLKCEKIRSATTCEAPKGLCALCYGLKSNGRLPAIGENVGIVAAQSAGEPLTQMVLSTKHSTGASDEDENELTGMEGFRTIVNSPDSFKQKAPVAPISGRIIRIDKAPQGGYYVYINSDKNKVYIPNGKQLKVKQGDIIYKGQPLSSGIVSVKDMTNYVGIGAARQHESNLLHQTFLNSTGKDLSKKHFEVLSRGHLNVAKDDTGDILNMNTALAYWKPVKTKKFLSQDLIGKYYLAENVDIFLKGTEITDYIYNQLKLRGINSVEVTEHKPPVKPVYKTLTMRPNFNRDLYSKLNYRYLNKAITDEVKRGKGFKTKDLTSDREKHTANKL